MANNVSKKSKKCAICGKEFIPHSNCQKYCSKECKLAFKREYDKKRNATEHRKEYRKQYEKEYFQKNKEYVKKRNKEYRNKNIKTLTNKRREYHLKNYQKHPLTRKVICEVCGKEFVTNSPVKKYCSEKCYIAKSNFNKNKSDIIKRKTNIQFKNICIARNFIHRCLRSKKTKHTFDILGYTPEMLKQRLEMNFKSDMNWGNYGKVWSIDHIKPLCKFNFVLTDGTPDYEQIRLANSLANLKPLYVEENLSKGGKLNING